MCCSDQEVMNALLNILESKSFRSSPQLAAFLKFTVEETLQGKSSGLKAYTIATCALGRDTSFDPQTDPIVRVEARRLRLILDQYYLREGPNDNVKIELLPGSYVPNFLPRTESVVDLNEPEEAQPALSPQHVLRPTRAKQGGEFAGMARSSPNRLLVLDDEPDIRSLIRKIGESVGFTVLDTSNANEFWVAYKALQPTLIVLDLVVPGTDGVEVLRELAQQQATCQIILISGMENKVLSATERLGRQFRLNVIGSRTKPFDIDDLSALMQPSGETAGPITADELSSAIDNHELALDYQPKFSLKDGEWKTLVGFEAFVRWDSPAKGLISPAQFIPLAEQSGQIGAFTDEVIRMGIEQMAQWNDGKTGLSFAIEVSRHALTDLSLPDRLNGLAADKNISTDRIILQMNEAAALGSDCELADVLARFRLKGFELALDAFGTGHSSLSDLFTMPFNEIKIDRSFVRELEENDEAKIIVSAIVGLAKNLGLRSCAVGLKSQVCAQVLAELDCDQVQGELFSRSVAADEVASTMELYMKPSASKLVSIA